MEGYEASEPTEPDTQPESSAASFSQSGSPMPLAEYEEYIRQYPFAAEPTYFTRPNRYYGPASTWRSWTADDRAVAESLDAMRAKDLSIHLINAFALKNDYNRNFRSDLARSNDPLSFEEDQTEYDSSLARKQFKLPNAWTAWPLPADQVPRSLFQGEPHGLGSWINTPARPSANLEDALIATTLKCAKERFTKRLSESVEPRVKQEKRDWQAERDATRKQLMFSGFVKDNRVDKENMTGASDDRGMVTLMSEDVETDADSPAESDVPEGVQTFSSQVFAANKSSSSDEETSVPDSEDDEPVTLADEDQARRIILPSVRHTLSKLDDLLTGLHKARQAYTRDHVTKSSQSRYTISGAETTDDDQFIRSGSRTGVRKRGRKRKRSLSAKSPGERQEVSRSRSRSRPRSTSRLRSIRSREHGLRDWSDIFGMAALTGWDTAVVARASERCARMFGQNMMFRTFHEPILKSVQDGGSKLNYDEEYAYVPPAEHAAHLHAAATVPDAAHTVTDREASDEASSHHSASERSGSLSARGTPIDTTTLRCPLSTCDQSAHIYTRSTRLYDHIRHAHPAFELDSYKKMIARNSSRGKYNRREPRLHVDPSNRGLTPEQRRS